MTVRAPYRAQPVRHVGTALYSEEAATVEWVPPTHERQVGAAGSPSEATWGGGMCIGFPGDCRMHHAQVLLAQGAGPRPRRWLAGRTEIDDFVREHAGVAFYIRGECCA